MSDLHPYMSFAGDSSEGAVLVFARTARAAVRVAARTIQGWTDCRYVDVRARRLRHQADYLMGLAEPALMTEGKAHVIEDPPTCARCEVWGQPITDGICTSCRDERFADATDSLENAACK